MAEDDEGSDDGAVEDDATEEKSKIVDFEAWKRKRLSINLLQQLRDFELLDKDPVELPEASDDAADGR